MSLAAVAERALERAQLLVDRVQRVDLRVDELGPLALEAAQVEDEAAEVAEAELAGPAQVAQAPPHRAAGAEAGGGLDDRLAGSLALRELGGLTVVRGVRGLELGLV